MKLLLPLLCIAAIGITARASEPAAKEGALLFSDDFERAELGAKWRASAPSFTIVDGALKGSQTRSNHGAVAAVPAAMRDGVIEFRFRFEGATSINAVCDDKTFTGSHAGHICRVTLTPTLLRIGDDREGGMRNDILEMRKDPARKAEGDKLMVGRTKTFPMKIEPRRWHLLRMEITDDELRASLNGQVVGSLKSPGIAHPTKDTFHFTVNGKDALIDDLRIWGKAGAK